MEWWQAILLGIVEGITEYLPVSSTGHLILASALLGLDDPVHEDAVNAFTIVIQGGAILAVAGVYAPRIARMIMGLLGRDANGLRLAMLLLVAFLPSAVLGVLLHDWIEATLFHAWPVLLALALGGVYMIVLDRWQKRRHREHEEAETLDIARLSFAQALAIGLMQTIAMWPGTSRSMMTITGGVLVGLPPRQAAEFSFLLGLPTLGGAMAYTLWMEFTRASGDPSMFEDLGVMPVVLGVVAATIAAALAVRWLISFLNTHGLAGFGYYRLVLCVVLGSAIVLDIVVLG